MEITIKKEHKNSLLGRTDFSARVAHQGATPTRQELREALAKHQKKDLALVIVRRIETEFGNQVSLVEASAYTDVAHLEKFEPAHLRKRHGETGDAPDAKPEGGA